jgi:hypothetical protein
MNGSSVININRGYLESVGYGIIDIINLVIVPVLMAVAFLFFIWGVYRYFIQGATTEADLKTGRNMVLWSVIGFAAIVSVWGLVALVLNTFGLGPGGSPPQYPRL